MTSRSVTRAAFLSGLAGFGAFAMATNAVAARNPDVEHYVEENASEALRTLGDRSVTGAERHQTFDELMAEFADMPRLAVWVLGRYGGQLRNDPVLRADWTRTFQEYAIATYETRLSRYSGGSIRVVGSVENVAGRDITVNTQLSPDGESRPLPVQWRLLRAGDTWKVMDVSLVFEGNNQIWLAQQQQLDFLAALDRNHGDIRALMTDVRAQTATMRRRTMAGN